MKIVILISSLLIGLSANAINPEREYKFIPDSVGLKYSEYQVKTTDNYTINVWEYKSPEALQTNRVLILVGPDGGNMGYLIWQARAFVQKGFKVISFDYRGFGRSADFPINKDYLFYTEFGLDLDSVIKSTRLKFPTSKIGLFSMSMGTHISLLADEKFDFSIAEGFFHDPQKVVDRIKVNRGKAIYLPQTAKSVTKAKYKVPMLIFCASKDKTTTTEDAKVFATENKVTIIEFDGDHLMGMVFYSKSEYADEYSSKVVEFLDREGI